jgi:hypothetical protein
MGSQRHASDNLPSGNRHSIHCTGVGGEPQGGPGLVRKNSLAPEFDPRTIRPVAVRYTD